MAGRIANLIKRPTPERPDIADAAAQLGRLAEARPDLRDGIALQVALMRAAFAEPVQLPKLALERADAAGWLHSGLPLLRGAQPAIAERDLRAVFLRLCAACKPLSPPVAAAAAELAEVARRGNLDLVALSRAMISGQAQAVPAELESAGLPVELALTLLRFTLLPFLEQAAAQLAPLRAEAPWKHGYCPTCGAWPLLAEQRGLELARYARCGLCTSSWPIDRVACGLCGNREHTMLEYIQIEGEERRQRAATCDSCGHYLKLRSTLQALTTGQLLVEEVALIHLDVIAMDKGYMPPM